MNLSSSNDKIAAANRAGYDAMYHMLHTSFDVSQKLFQLQIEATNRLVEQNINNTKCFFGFNGSDVRRANDWQNLIANNMRNFIELTRSFYEVAAETQHRVTQEFKDNIEPAINEVVNQTQNSVKEGLDNAQHAANAANNQAQKTPESGRSRKTS